MKRFKLFVICYSFCKKAMAFASAFLLFVSTIFAQHITVPIHYSKWIQNFSSDAYKHGFSGENHATPFSEIPIAFFMKDTGTVERFEKLEIGICLPEDVKIQIANFIRNGRGINPFDPEQISITAYFSHTQISRSFNNSIDDIINTQEVCDAFYYEEFHIENDPQRFPHGNWKQDSSSYNFRIRFAPRLSGNWKCVIVIASNNKPLYTLPSFEFICTPSISNGFINGISENKRLLQFENGKNFFGIGQNIPIADMPNAMKPYGLSKYREQPPQGFVLQREYIVDLAKNGGNLARIMHGEWADALEWEKLNDYSMNMNFAWEFDQTVNTCWENNIYILWLQQVHTAFMARNPFNNDDLAWPANPYHLALDLEKPEAFFTDERAMKAYKNKIRYMLSRWGYSRMIAGIQPMSEINEMAANLTDLPAHHPYFTDTSFRNKVGKWFLEIKNYIQKDLGYDFLVGSSFTGDVGAHVVDDPVMKIADFNDYHPYGQNRNRNLAARYGGINITPGYGIFKRYQKPVIIGEMGTWDTYFLEACHENEFHNDIWGTAFIGGWGIGLHWHNWEDNFNMDLRSNFNGINEFFNSVDFTNAEWSPQRWPEKNINDSIYSEKKADYFEVLYMTNDNSAWKSLRAIGWVHNRSSYWYNYSQYTDCENELSDKQSKKKTGRKEYRPADDDTSGFVKYEGEKNEKKRKIKIKGMQKFRRYQIQWYNTMDGSLIDMAIKFHGFGNFKITIPDDINEQKYQDLAFKIVTKNKGTVLCKLPNY